jgi:hypothetical protein
MSGPLVIPTSGKLKSTRFFYNAGKLVIFWSNHSIRSRHDLIDWFLLAPRVFTFYESICAKH